MKNFNLFFLLLIGFATPAFSQRADKCATMPVYKSYLENQTLKQAYQIADLKAKQWLANPLNKQNASQRTNAVITIPVVVHVVYKNAIQNIPDTQIVRQIEVLNQCFRKQNPNFSNTRAIFDTLGADIEIQFCLAATDPQGNPTTGINRKSVPTNAAFDPLLNMDKVKSSSTNGVDAWDNTKYLNIWVCDMSLFGQAFVLGYATFPGGPANLDGIVIQSEYFGKYAAPSPNHLGRTSVHEIGHWLGMRHIWADDDGGAAGTDCDSTDFVDDTPNQGAKSESDCNLTINSCSAESAFWGTIDAPDMVENYMDYSADECMTMFTKGQKARMYSYLNTDPARISLKTSNVGCSTVGINDYEKYFAESIYVYPNPTEHTLHLNVTNFTAYNLKAEIYNQQGQLVKIIQALDFQNVIDVSSLNSGIYSVKIFNSDFNTCKKIVILH
jgi:hypothetical protein